MVVIVKSVLSFSLVLMSGLLLSSVSEAQMNFELEGETFSLSVSGDSVELRGADSEGVVISHSLMGSYGRSDLPKTLMAFISESARSTGSLDNDKASGTADLSLISADGMGLLLYSERSVRDHKAFFLKRSSPDLNLSNEKWTVTEIDNLPLAMDGVDPNLHVIIGHTMAGRYDFLIYPLSDTKIQVVAIGNHGEFPIFESKASISASDLNALSFLEKLKGFEKSGFEFLKIEGLGETKTMKVRFPGENHNSVQLRLMPKQEKEIRRFESLMTKTAALPKFEGHELRGKYTNSKRKVDPEIRSSWATWEDMGKIEIVLGPDDKSNAAELLKSAMTDLTAEAAANPLFDDITAEVDPELLRSVMISLGKDKVKGLDFVGEAGVGKSFFMSLLAEALLFHPDVPDRLRKTQVFRIDPSSLAASGGKTGQSEAKVAAIIEVAKAYPDAIFLIDEIHSLKGMGTHSENPTDNWQLMKPFMADGTLVILGFGTQAELDITYAGDRPLKRRRVSVPIIEKTEAETRDILQVLWGRKFDLGLPAEAAESLVEMAGRFNPSEVNPGRAVDFFDYTQSAWKLDGQTDREFLYSDVVTYAKSMYGVDPDMFSREALKERAQRIHTVFTENVIGLDYVGQIFEDKAIDHILNYHRDSPPGQRVLLVGPSGSGKTHAFKVLALAMSDKSKLSELENGKDYFQIDGPSVFTAQKLAEALADAVSANPYAVIALDEYGRMSEMAQELLLKFLVDGIVTVDRNGNMETLRGNRTMVVLTANNGQDYVSSLPDISNFSLRHFNQISGLNTAVVDRTQVVPVQSPVASALLQIINLEIENLLTELSARHKIDIQFPETKGYVNAIVADVASVESVAQGAGFVHGDNEPQIKPSVRQAQQIIQGTSLRGTSLALKPKLNRQVLEIVEGTEDDKIEIRVSYDSSRALLNIEQTDASTRAPSRAMLCKLASKSNPTE